MSLLSRSWNLANLLVLVGVLVLVLSFWVPEATASRVARIEGWAENIARALLTAARNRPELEFDGAGGEALRRALDPVYAERLEALPADDDPPALRFAGKHYLYMVTRFSAPAEGDEEPSASLEVYAWPRSYLAAGRTAFFVPEEGEPAYTRNLAARYRGDEVVPWPGAARPLGTEVDHHGAWRGRDEERWLPLP